MKKISYIVLMAVMVLMVCGCRRQPGPAVMQLYELTDTAPAQALAGLDSLTTANLSEAERRLADFVRLKASDKVYITHTSDSTILALLDYYEDDDRFGSEVLYYAGRVYSDLGDYPTALSYFQKALQATPTVKNLRLRSAIASQTGRLLNSLCMRSEAVPYLKESLLIDSLLRDTINLMYDNQLIGSIYMNLNKLDSAQNSLQKSKLYSMNFTDLDRAETDLYLSRLELLRNQPEKAISLVRGLENRVDSFYYNLSLLYSAQAYLSANKMDSAYIYVDPLIHIRMPKDKHTAYDILFNTTLQNYIPQDSLKTYLNHYQSSVKRYFQTYEAQASINQNAMYNYQLHKIKRLEAERKHKTGLIGLNILLMCFLVSIAIVFYYRNRNLKNIILLRKTLDDFTALRLSINNTTENNTTENNTTESITKDSIESGIEVEETPTQSLNNQNETEAAEKIDSTIETEVDEPSEELNSDMLKQRLREEILKIFKDSPQSNISEKVKTSEVCISIKKMADNNQRVNERSPLWGKLESIIKRCHPNFFEKLNLLFGRPLKEEELRIVMLIKSGFTPTAIAILVGRAKGSISSRRARLCEEIFKTKSGAKVFDDLIRYL